MRRLRARAIPYSSVVGGGVMLLDETGAVLGQLILLNGGHRFSREQHESICAQVIARINGGDSPGLELYGDDEPEPPRSAQ